MNTLEIVELVSKHQYRNIFHGVFACDTLPREISLPFVGVVNLSKKSEIGTHWIAIFIDAEKRAYYFDSFALLPENEYIISFLRTHSKGIKYNTKQIQNISSRKCGKFCCAFAIAILRNESVQDFLKEFNVNLFLNDLIVENMIKYLK